MSEYKCEICNYSTNYIQNYNRHINSSKHKKKVCPPKKVIKIPLTKGIGGIFLSNIHIMINAIIVAIIRGGIAIDKFFSLL